MSLKRFGVSLEDNLLESLDQYVDENGFANRSQAIRFLIEKNVAEKKWQKLSISKSCELRKKITGIK